MSLSRTAKRMILGVAAAISVGLNGAPVVAETIIVGTSLTQAPYGFYDAQQKPTGIDVSMCGSLVKQLGAEAEFVSLDFKGLIPAMQAKRFDMLCAAAYITPEREQAILMVPYMVVSQAVMTRPDSTVTQLSDLCGRAVSTLQGSSTVKVLEAESSRCRQPIEIRTFDTQPIAIRALENSNVDAFLGTDPLISFYLLRNPGLRKAFSGLNPMVLGIGIHKDNPDAAKRVRDGLVAMKQNGNYATVLRQWGIEAAGLVSFDSAKP